MIDLITKRKTILDLLIQKNPLLDVVLFKARIYLYI